MGTPVSVTTPAGSLDARFLALLALVRDGMGPRDARQPDLLISSKHESREGGTVLDELIELERRGLVRRGEGGTGYKWTITDADLKPWRFWGCGPAARLSRQVLGCAAR